MASAQPRSRLFSTVNFDLPGVQAGYIEVPFSHDRSAYGHIPIPVVTIKGGAGPRVLLTGGNHGDEYEGPIALSKIIHRLSSQTICGQLIIIPALNLPAVLNGTRTSPIDGGNLNRMFPGSRDGSVTEMIAHYVETELFPRVDIAIDLHAGGGSFNHLPTLLIARPSSDADSEHARYMKLVDVFAAPRYLELDMLGEDRTYSAACARSGIWFIGGEFGGAAHCDPDCLEIVESGVRRVLHHLGMTPEDIPPAPMHTPQPLAMSGRSHYVFSRNYGIFEPCFRLGERVKAGQVAGRIYSPNAPWEAPHDVYFQGDGIVLCSRTFADVSPGDCLVMLASDDVR